MDVAFYIVTNDGTPSLSPILISLSSLSVCGGFVLLIYLHRRGFQLSYSFSGPSLSVVAILLSLLRAYIASPLLTLQEYYGDTKLIKKYTQKRVPTNLLPLVSYCATRARDR